MFVDNGESVTLVAGNDGGSYTQTIADGDTDGFDNDHWGRGANLGYYTLQPYDARIAKDGVVYAGLQDNGELRIEPDGKQVQIKDGDGFFTAVDWEDSDFAYEEYTGGHMFKTSDGGKHWTDINPTLVGGLFAAPFAMDPTDPDVLVAAGRDVKITEDASASSTWTKVFDLGTQKHPGDAGAAVSADDPQNTQSAISITNGTVYVGYCGVCDLATQTPPVFGSGVATNIGGDWHIAKAAGLPKRYITSIQPDPTDLKTVYVTLGGYGRRWIPPGAVGDDVSKVGKGHVFVSHDGGESFTDISGNLPDAPANWTVLHKGQLVVATSLGVFASNSRTGGTYAVLGKGLPTAPVFTLEIARHDPDLLVAATFGRGVQVYKFGKTDLQGPTTGFVPGTGNGGGGSGSGGSGGGLPSTGAPTWVYAGPVVLMLALLIRRRRRATRTRAA
jgi:hypothetical protein